MDSILTYIRNNGMPLSKCPHSCCIGDNAKRDGHYRLYVKTHTGIVVDRPAHHSHSMRYEKEPLLSAVKHDENAKHAKKAEHTAPSKLMKFVAWSAASRGIVFDADSYGKHPKRETWT